MSSCHTPPSTSPDAKNPTTTSSSSLSAITSSAPSADTTTPSPPPTPEQSSEITSTQDCTPSTAMTPFASSCSSISPTMSQQQNLAAAEPVSALFDVINHPVKDTLTIVSTLLSLLLHKNDSRYNPLCDPITLFHSRAVPRISVEAYLTRILQYIPFTNEVLLNVLVYLDRIGGLEGVHLHLSGKLSSTTTATSVSAPVTVSSASASFSAANEISSMASSSPKNNSDNGLPMISKRGREDKEERAEQVKRVRSTTSSPSSSSSSSSCSPSSSISTPVSTPACSPAPEGMPSYNGFRINSFNIHRLLITCLMVAGKFTSDLFYSNARYAKVGGLSLPELNQLELEFLFTSKFELNVKVDELQRIGNALLRFRDRHMARVTQQHQHQQQHQQQYQHQQLLLLHLQQQQQQLQQQHQHQQQNLAAMQPVQRMEQMHSPISPCSASASTAAADASVPVPGMDQDVKMQRPQLLSPPEEKHSWTESEVQESHAQVHV